MPIDRGESSFKALFNRENTNDPPAKQFYEEKGRPSLKIKSEDIWAEDVDKADPANAVAAGVAELRTLFVLTEDVTVPGQATWVADDTGTRLEDWIDIDDGDPTLNPASSLHRIRLFDGTDAEIFPTDPSEPFFNAKQGILRFGGAVTRPTPFKVTGYRYIGQKGVGGSVAANSLTVSEDITFSVDYNDGTAVYPPADSAFTTQAQLDAYLASQGTTNVRDMESAYNSLALIIPRDVTITMNLAAGIHRPSAAGKPFDASWLFGAKQHLGSMVINGPAPSSFNVVSALSTLSVDVVSTNAGSPSGGGSIQTSGTPFTGLDLRGHYIRLTTGQTTVISANTNDTVFTLADLSPAPVVATDTFDIVEPSCELRNSLDDTNLANTRAVSIELEVSRSNFPFALTFNNIKCVGGANATGFFTQTTLGPGTQYNYCQVDQMNALPSALRNGGGWRYFNGSFALSECSVRAIGTSTADEHILVSGSSINSNAATCYFGGAEAADGIEVENGAELRLLGCLVDESSVQCRGAQVTMESFGGFFYEGTIQNTPGGNPALVWDNASVSPNTPLGQEYRISGCTGPCVQISNRATLNQTVDFIDGGGNTDVGIEVGISHNLVEISGPTTVTGTAGDTRIAGAITAYGALPTQASALSGQEFDGFNLINKG